MPIPSAPGVFKREPVDVVPETNVIEIEDIAEDVTPVEESDERPAYISLGQLTADELLEAKSDKFADIKEDIQEVSDWIHDQLKDMEKIDDVVSARVEGGKKYLEVERLLDSLILRKLNTDRKFPRGPERKILIAAVINEILGLGPLEPLWKDSRITEIMANGPYDVQVEIAGKIHKVPGAKFRSQEHLLELCQNVLRVIGRRVDVNNPIEDGRLPDMSRVHVVHNAIAPKGPNLTIRRHREEAWTIEELVRRGAMSEEIAQDLAFYIHSGLSTVVVGGTGSGKTTVLNALSGLIPFDERIVTIEDNLELQLHPDRLFAAPMEARPSSASGKGAISIRDLVKASLRMRPNRIIVGECRDSAAYDMLQAMNTGHNGSMTTIHANGAEEAIPRLESLVGQAGEMDSRGVAALIAGAVDLLVIVDRYPEDGSRRLVGIYEVPSRIETEQGGGHNLTPIPLWEFVHDSTEPGTNKVIGHYERINEPSELLVRKHRLNRRNKFTIEEVYEMSGV